MRKLCYIMAVLAAIAGCKKDDQAEPDVQEPKEFVGSKWIFKEKIGNKRDITLYFYSQRVVSFYAAIDGDPDNNGGLGVSYTKEWNVVTFDDLYVPKSFSLDGDMHIKKGVIDGDVMVVEYANYTTNQYGEKIDGYSEYMTFNRK